MQTICTSLLTGNYTNTSSLNFYWLEAQPTVSKYWRQRKETQKNVGMLHFHCYLTTTAITNSIRFISSCTGSHISKNTVALVLTPNSYQLTHCIGPWSLLLCTVHRTPLMTAFHMKYLSNCLLAVLQAKCPPLLERTVSQYCRKSSTYKSWSEVLNFNIQFTDRKINL